MKLSMLCLSLVLVLGACTKKNANKEVTSELKGQIVVDGSSTVYPITEAVAEEFRRTYPDVRVTVGLSGTGGGFKKFYQGEIDITDASRPIKEEEKQKLKENNIDYIELEVAYDGISIVVNHDNNWVTDITTQELNQIWKSESSVKTWKDVRSTWPNRPIKLYGPGPDSGTFDYFTEVINHKGKSCRSDYTKSEDDNVLVTGIKGDKDSLGYFGFAYYKENAAGLKVIPVNAGKGQITPTEETIRTGTYAPLSRPLYVYVSKKSLTRPEVLAFLKFYLSNVSSFISQVGYIGLPPEKYQEQLTKLEQK
ncbi:MAG: PstS family phosphate ABC transporter substrate-binding protein [Bacteriovoracaceae bacterium]|nr:PstS family phosphate ABC transporter substrate-binding protein [Bacteriovoracaceae bacterium]